MRRSTLTSVLMALVLVLSMTAGAGTMAVAADDGDSTDDTETTEDDADDNETTDNETDLNESEGNETLNESQNSDDAFGLLVSAFVADLQENGTEGPFGIAVANFVLANNPAADMIPDHAGPPTNMTQGPPDNVTQGPPTNSSQGPGGDQGPPDQAGGNGDNGGGGPPDHAGGQ